MFIADTFYIDERHEANSRDDMLRMVDALQQEVDEIHYDVRPMGQVRGWLNKVRQDSLHLHLISVVAAVTFPSFSLHPRRSPSNT
jgi:hypothetical protein